MERRVGIEEAADLDHARAAPQRATDVMRQVPAFRPEVSVTGPAYSPWFKMLATLLTFGLVAYVSSYLLRYRADSLSGLLLVAAIVFLLLSYRGFLRATVTIDAQGIRQSGWPDKQVVWDEVRSAKLIGLPKAGWLSPPRLAVRTGTAFYTFNGGTQELLTEFARLSVAYEMRK